MTSTVFCSRTHLPHAHAPWSPDVSVHHLRLGRGALIHKVGASVKTRAASFEVGTPAPFIHTDAHRYTHMVRNRHTQPHTCNISARKPRVT